MSEQVVARSRWRDGTGPIWALATAMLAVAVGLNAHRFGDFPPEQLPGPQWWALLLVFAAGEIFVIHLPATRSSHSLTLREIPAVIGLTFLTGAEYTTAYVLGAGLALLLWSRQRGVKLAFNAAMYGLEASLGLLTYHALLGGVGHAEPRAWLAALAAVLVTDLVSAAAVTAAISLTERSLDDQVLREALHSGLPGAVVNTCVALLVVVLLEHEPAGLVLVAVLVPILGLAYRGYVSLVTRHARLELLYRFVGSTGDTADLDGLVGAVLREAAALLRAAEAELLVLPTAEEPGSRSVLRDGSVVQNVLPGQGLTEQWWSPAVAGTPVLRPAETARRGAASGTPLGDHRDGIAVHVPISAEVRAVLLVLDRTFEQETFSTEDLRLLETLAGHIAVTLDKARLVDRLRRLAAQRDHEANHDALTGLPNRRAFQQSVQDAVARGEGGAVLLIDLDDFKDVNDTLGHAAGDALITVTGTRLQEYRRGTVARLGGDEFAVLLPGASAEEALRHARALRQIISEPVSMGGISVIATASVGMAALSDDLDKAQHTLTHADVAMYAAKQARSGVEPYTPDGSGAVHRRLALAGDLAAALERDELSLWFQPQVDAVRHRPLGLEALLRWRHPVHGYVPPLEVIAVAERTGLGRILSARILEQALRQRATWADRGHDLVVSVNMTPRDLLEERVVDTVSRLLLTTGTPPARLVLEITEHDVMSDPERCLTVLRQLRELGVQLSVDDFGTGHSSLAYLERLPVQEVKIDQGFVSRLGTDPADSAIIRATVALAHELGLRVVAEGVEDHQVMARVRTLGCDVVQGYGVARPMPADQVMAWLDDRLATPRRTA